MLHRVIGSGIIQGKASTPPAGPLTFTVGAAVTPTRDVFVETVSGASTFTWTFSDGSTATGKRPLMVPGVVTVAITNPENVVTLQMSVANVLLSSVLNLDTLPNLVTLDLSRSLITSLVVPDLAFLKYLILSNCTSLSSLTMGNLPVLEDLKIDGGTLITSLDLTNYPSLVNFWTFTFPATNPFASVTFPSTGMPSLTDISCGSSVMTSIDLRNMPSLQSVGVYNNYFNQAAVDAALAAMVANGCYGGGFSSFNGPNMAAPSAAGYANVAVLTARGNMVFTN